jgi:hypothetical protein
MATQLVPGDLISTKSGALAIVTDVYPAQYDETIAYQTVRDTLHAREVPYGPDRDALASDVTLLRALSDEKLARRAEIAAMLAETEVSYWEALYQRGLLELFAAEINRRKDAQQRKSGPPHGWEQCEGIPITKHTPEPPQHVTVLTNGGRYVPFLVRHPEGGWVWSSHPHPGISKGGWPWGEVASEGDIFTVVK